MQFNETNYTPTFTLEHADYGESLDYRDFRSIINVTAYHYSEYFSDNSLSEKYSKIDIKICDETDFSSIDHKKRFKKLEDIFK